MEEESVLLIVALLSAAAAGFVLARFAWLRMSEAMRGRRVVRRSGSSSGIEPLMRKVGSSAVMRPTYVALRLGVIDREMAKWCEALEASGVRSRKEDVLASACLTSGAVAILVGVASSSALAALASACCVLMGLSMASARRCERERAKMREGFPELLQSMKACFMVGYSLPQTLQEASAGTQGRTRALLNEAQSVIKTGGTVEGALDVLKQRGGESELVFLATALEIQHRTGGSMQRVLEATRQTIIDELSLKRSLRTQTAQVRLSAQIVTIMPFALIGVFSLLSPGFLDPFFESLAGMFLLAAALVMQAAGVLAVRKMLKVEVV